MRKRPIVCVDIDGVLDRDQFSRYGGLGAFGKAVWWALRSTGVAERLMREAVPDVLAREWLGVLRSKGYRIVLLTARLEQYRKLTEEWLKRHCIPYGTLDMRRPDESIEAHKLAVARRSAGCVLLIDDTMRFAARSPSSALMRRWSWSVRTGG